MVDVQAPGRGLGGHLSVAAAARYAAPIGLVVVFVAFFIATPNFLTLGNISDLLVSAAILLVLAMGQQEVPRGAELLRRVRRHRHASSSLPDSRLPSCMP